MKKGDIVTCIDNANSPFHLGSKYLIEDVTNNIPGGSIFLTINGRQGWLAGRFALEETPMIQPFRPTFSLEEIEWAATEIEAMK